MSFYGAITEHLFNACRRDYVRRNIWKRGEFRCVFVCMFGLLFASLCAANSYNVRFKCEMEYWFINSIYGEHNLQKFTNVFIKWNFIRWLFGLQSYFHTVPYSIEWMLLCVLQQSMLLQNYAFHSLHSSPRRPVWQRHWIEVSLFSALALMPFAISEYVLE